MKKKNPTSEQGVEQASGSFEDPFLLGFSFSGVDLAEAGIPPSGPVRRRKKPRRKRVAKHDVRRHFSRMLLSAINANSHHAVSTFLRTFMKRDCKFHLEYSCTLEPTNTMVSEGPAMTSFFISGLGVLFPDIVFQEDSCQLFTSSLRNDTTLVIKGSFHCTPIYCVSFQRTIDHMHTIYARRGVEAPSRDSNSSFEDDDSPEHSSSSDADSQVGSAKSGNSEQAFEPHHRPKCPLVDQLHQVFNNIPVLPASQSKVYACTITIIMDESNKMEHVVVTVADK